MGIPVKFFLALFLLIASPVYSQQGIPAPALASTISSNLVTLWTCGVNGIAATLTQCQAAPAAGLKLYLTDIIVQTTTTTSGTYAIQTGTGSNCATGTAALFPVSATGNRFNAPITTSAAAHFKFETPLAAPAANAICLIGVATNTISAQMIGYIAP